MLVAPVTGKKRLVLLALAAPPGLADQGVAAVYSPHHLESFAEGWTSAPGYDQQGHQAAIGGATAHHKQLATQLTAALGQVRAAEAGSPELSSRNALA